MKFELKKLNKIYVNKKQQQLKRLEEDKEALNAQLLKKGEELKKKSSELERIMEVNNSLKLQYENYKKMLIDRGLIFEIENRFISVKEWDSLIVKRIGSRYYILTKQDEKLYEFGEDISEIFDEICRGDNKITAIVVRINPRILKLRLNILKK